MREWRISEQLKCRSRKDEKLRRAIEAAIEHYKKKPEDDWWQLGFWDNIISISGYQFSAERFATMYLLIDWDP